MKISKINKSKKLWKKANKFILGGNMLLSKHPDFFVPNLWPAYFKKTNGIHVWDLDYNKYIDMAYMGVGTNILGYSNKNINNAVKQVVKEGNMSSLNCPEEVELAETLIKMHGWADFVKFARTGGEANAIAIRMARAYTKKDNIAVCGYHGWHDWYLSANLKNRDTLSSLLMSGLEIAGVPQILKNSIYTFEYNNFESLLKLIKNKNIGTIMMEVKRNHEPKNNFLEKIRDICKKQNICLIFDECTSGFRENYGGLHLKYQIEPDIAVFGKALGNGYAITSVLARGKYKKISESSFMSSTFWTERIGPTAAVATLKQMKKIKSWKIITNLGIYYQKKLKEISFKNELEIDTRGLPSLTSYSFRDTNNNQKYKTLISQEMLLENYLATNSTYFSTIHSKSTIDKYIQKLNKVFKSIKECEDGRSIDKLIKNNTARSGFKRLN